MSGRLVAAGLGITVFFVDNILIEYIPRPSLISPIVTPVEDIRHQGR